MSLFGKFFSSKIKSTFSSASFVGSYRDAQGKSYGGGGWGLARFRDIINAHSDIEGIVEEWGLDSEDCEYMSLDGYDNPWTQAYEEELEKAEMMADMLAALGIDVDPEELIDWEVVDEKAYRYAEQLAQAWLNGDEWIPEEVMDWAWYDLSDHNN